eukprot:TRINITY_DN293_c1_g1_i1.p1 TRINITY_DN293_c1_g1~~TRINITY_DN293_c1_g1_i1.p1  ORF type:complete len:785 (+),score=320.43 TRINITY_DN293_c1_g1_i1:69-2357(+)
MGVASSVGAATKIIGGLVNGGHGGAHDVDIPMSQINATHNTNQAIKSDVVKSLATISTVITKLEAAGGKWQNLDIALEIVDDSEAMLNDVKRVKAQWATIQNQINDILQNIKKPSVWDDILAGVTGGVAGLAMSILKTQEVDNMQNTYRKFSSQTVSVQTDLFTVSKNIKDLAAEGRTVINQSTQDAWGRFIPTMRANCVKLQSSMKEMLSNADKLDGTLRKLAGNRPVNFMVMPVAWNQAPPNQDNAVVRVPLSMFPSYRGKTSGKKRPSSGKVLAVAKRSCGLSRSAMRQVALLSESSEMKPTLLGATSEQKTAQQRKETIAVAQQKAYEQVHGHLVAQKNSMKNDITKYSAVTVAVSQGTPAKPDDENNVWDQFATAADNIGDWAGDFVTAMQNAPIENDTRREIFDVCQEFYHLMQTTSLKLQGYRLSVGKIANAMGNVVNVLVPPDDIKQNMKNMANNKEKVKEIQGFAAMNKDALSTSLKDLSKLLNDHAALDDLNNLHGHWSTLQKSIENVQVDVKADIEAFKKKMKIIGWVTMGITAVVGLAVIIGTMGAAAPEVAAVAAEEVAEEAAIEAAEVGTEVAVDTMVDGAVDGAIDAGEAEAEAEGSVTSAGSKALNIFTKIGKGVVTMGVLGGLSEGAKALVDKIRDTQLDVIHDAKAGLDEISNDVNLIETMLFYIYKHWSELDQDPVLSANDPLKPLSQAWGRINVKPLLDSLQKSEDTMAIIQKQLKGAEDNIDKEIGSYNVQVYQPLLKIFG